MQWLKTFGLAERLLASQGRFCYMELDFKMSRSFALYLVSSNYTICTADCIFTEWQNKPILRISFCLQETPPTEQYRRVGPSSAVFTLTRKGSIKDLRGRMCG